MHIKQQQQRDSVRVVWNVMADNKTLQSKAAIPQALHYTPLQYKEDSLLSHTPPRCPTCSAYMNVYSAIHLTKLHYTCCICEQINEFPPNYIKKSQPLPPELSLDYSSFLIAKRVRENKTKTGYLFVVDLAISQKQLQPIKTAIIDLINVSSEDTVVGLVTYAKYVQLYDLAASINTFLAFSPNNQYNTQTIVNLIGYANCKVETVINNKYLSELKTCKKEIIQTITNLKRIVPQIHKHQRQARAVGQALNIALTLNQLSLSNPQIIFFCGGVCTIGGGKVIEQDYKTQMRSIKSQPPKMSQSATEFYDNLIPKCKKKSAAIHSFVFSMEEVGLTEMIDFLTATGGLLVQHEQFDSDLFRHSFTKAFGGSQDLPQLEMATEASMRIHCSNEVKIGSCVGDQLLNWNEQSQYIVLGNLDERSTFTIRYDLANVKATADSYHIQMVTAFCHPEDNSIQFERVTTIRRVFSPNLTDIAAEFDEEAALSLLAKLTIQKSIDSSSQQLRHWLDNLLCKWAALFAKYAPNNRQSFRLSDNMKSFPQYIYHLRRSAIVRKSGMSLDEYHYIGHIMKGQTVTNVVRMIQPALLEYSPEQPSAKGVALDERYMKLEVILLLDSFFNIVEWHGKNIESWLQNDYQNQPQYKYLRELLQAPRQDIKLLTSTRFPHPTYYLTCSGHSKERFLKSRLSSRLDEHNQNNLSDEADITAFTQRLIDLVVNKQI